jgi:putative transposase
MPRLTLSSYYSVSHHRPRARGPLCVDARAYEHFEQTLGHALRSLPLRVVAYVLMPGHWHLIVGPTRPAALAAGLLRVGSAQPELCTPLDSTPLPTISDVIVATRSLERAPLDAGLVRRAQDWPWSSLARRGDPAAPLPLVPATFLGSRTWADYVNLPWTRPPALGHDAKAPGRLA